MLANKMVHLFGRRAYSSSSYFYAVLTQVVPALGESITEGTVAKWAREVGDKVDIDDVIAVVETDKVTVDIKSIFKGTLMEKMVQESATVVVDAPIFKIDSDASVSSISLTQNAKHDGILNTTIPKDNKASGLKQHGRIPRIKFKGKRNLNSDIATSTPLHLAVVSTKVSTDTKHQIPVKVGKGVHFWEMKGGAWYGRPTMSDLEINAIESGGASLFNPPEKRISKGSR